MYVVIGEGKEMSRELERVEEWKVCSLKLFYREFNFFYFY